MFKNLRRSLLALAVVAGSTVAVPVGAGSAGAVSSAPAASALPSIGAMTAPAWSNTNIIAVATGFNSSCAIQGSSSSATSGVLFCWGRASTLGTGANLNSNVPVMVSAANGFSNTAVSAVAIGDEHACAIEGGKLWCWGSAFISGQWGVLGNGGGTATTPALVSANGDFHNSGTSGDMVTAVSANYARTCAIEGGQTFCWGNNNALQLGLGSNSSNPINVPSRVVDTATPELQAATATKLTDGFFHTCAIASGSLYCWGMNGDSQLGNTSPAQGVPVKVAQGGFTSSNSNITDVDAGNYQTCAVQSGKAFCWGQNSSGQLGTGNTTASSTPVAVQSTGSFANSGSVSSVTSGEDHSCAIDNGKLFCWGINTWRQLGDGTTNDSTSPVMVAASDVPGFNNTAVTAVSAGEQHTCAIENKVVYCWGGNSSYQLGNNSFYPEDKPVKVFVVSAPAAPTISVMAGSSGTLSVGVNKPNDGGSTITSYEYQVDSGSPVTVAFDGYNYQTITISGLTNGTSYSVKVRAVNAIGTGSWSAPSSGTPSAGGGGGGGGGGFGTCSGGASIMPSSLTVMGTVGQPMSIPAPTPSGYSTAPTFTLANNSYFPPGLNLSSNGSISGTPTSSASGMTSAITVSNGSQSCAYLITFNITGNSTPCVAGAPSSTNSAVTFDSSFSSDGVYQFTSQSGSPAAVDVKAGPNGTLVVAAMEGVNFGGGSPTNSSTIIYRVLSDGSLDTTWGNGGVANIDVDAGTNYGENVRNIVVLSDGSVLVSMQVYIAGMSSTQEIRVAKLTSAGALDTNFATNGFATIHSGSGMNSVYPLDMVAGPSGSVFLVGFVSSGTPSTNVYKVQANGSLDSSFATNGILNIASTGSPVASDGSGNLYVGGRTSSNPANASLVKYTTAGVLDTTFGTNGQVVFDISQSSSESLSAITLDNGKITGIVRSLTGMGMMPTYSESAVRVDADGDIDASFGTAGIATLGTGSTSTQEILVLADGSALLSGFSIGMTPEWTVLAIGSDGSSVGTLVTSPAKISSGTCSISEGSIAVIPSGVYVAGSNYPSGGGSGSAKGFMFKIALNGVSSGGGSGGGSAPTLVTSANQSLLERDPGSEGMIINGQSVTVDTTRVEISAARTPASQRTPAQVAAIQAAGQALLQQFVASLPAGAVTNVTVVNTTTGAVMRNLVFDANGNSKDVPVEDIVILDGPSLSLMIGSDNANITSDGKYQVGAGGIIGVVGSGLGASAPGELVVMSTPTLIGNFTTSATGDVSKSAALPSSIGVGDHTLVVATGNTFAVMGLRVVPSSLPTTGLTEGSGRTMVIALFTLVFAAVLVRSRRLTLLAR